MNQARKRASANESMNQARKESGESDMEIFDNVDGCERVFIVVCR